MIGVTAAVVANGHADVLRNLLDVSAQILDALLGNTLSIERRIQVGHVRIVMLVVMDLHRLGIDVRFQGVVRIWQRRQCVWHVRVSYKSCGYWYLKDTAHGTA